MRTFALALRISPVDDVT